MGSSSGRTCTQIYEWEIQISAEVVDELEALVIAMEGETRIVDLVRAESMLPEPPRTT